MRRGWGARVGIAGALLAAAGCASQWAGSPEVAPVQLRSAQTGAQERCGIEMIREVQRANDLTWSESIFYSWAASREANAARADEERWRQECVERFKKQGFEVVTAPPAR